MTGSDQLRTEIARLEAKAARLQKDHAKARSRPPTQPPQPASNANTPPAPRATPPVAPRRPRPNARRRPPPRRKKAADLAGKIAETNKTISTKAASLASAQRSEDRACDREDDRRRTKEKTHARDVARLTERPMQSPTCKCSHPSPNPCACCT